MKQGQYVGKLSFFANKCILCGRIFYENEKSNTLSKHASECHVLHKHKEENLYQKMYQFVFSMSMRAITNVMKTNNWRIINTLHSGKKNYYSYETFLKKIVIDENVICDWTALL